VKSDIWDFELEKLKRKREQRELAHKKFGLRGEEIWKQWKNDLIKNARNIKEVLIKKIPNSIDVLNHLRESADEAKFFSEWVNDKRKKNKTQIVNEEEHLIQMMEYIKKYQNWKEAVKRSAQVREEKIQKVFARKEEIEKEK